MLKNVAMVHVEHQRGFLMVGAGIVMALLGLSVMLLWNRLDACHKETAKVEAAYAVLAQKVEEQNQKVAEWARVAEDRSGRAKAALVAEKARGASIKAEIEALRKKLADSKGKTCQDAISDIRSGLR